MSEGPEKKWAVYESNVQQYRVLSATVQSFLLAVGSVLFTQSNVPNLLMLLVAALGVAHVFLIWYPIVKARHRIIDYYKFQFYCNLSQERQRELAVFCKEEEYVHDDKKWQDVNAQFFDRPKLKLWRETRHKLDRLVPGAYVLIWIGLVAWKQPWKLPLW